ncbi:hypothetical protein Tco_0522043 [Tanacetum coccineum]
MEEEEVEAFVKTLKLLELLEHHKLLKKVEEEVEVAVESQKEFLVNLISFDTSYELRPDLLEVDLNGHGPLTSPVLHRGSCDLYGFCRTRFPTFIAEESLSCQLLIGYVVLCYGWSGGGGRVVVVVTTVVVAVDVGSGG